MAIKSGGTPGQVDQDEDEISSGGILGKALDYGSAYARRAVHGAIPFMEKAEAASDTVFGKIAEWGGGKTDPGYASHEADALSRLKQAKEMTDTFGTGNAVEMAGGFFSPLNKLAKATKPVDWALRKMLPSVYGQVAQAVPKGVIAGATNLGLKGAAAGGASAIGSYLGETPNADISGEGMSTATKEGMGAGAVFGTLAGGGLGRLASKEDDLLIKSLASTAGDVRMPGRGAGAVGDTAKMEHALKIGKGAREQGITGGFLQGVPKTHANASAATDMFEDQMNNIRGGLLAKADATGNPKFLSSTGLLNKVVTEVEDDLTRNGRKLMPQQRKALEEVKSLLMSQLYDTKMLPNGREVYDSASKAGLREIHNGYQNLHLAVHGPQGKTDVSNLGIEQDVMLRAERRLKRAFRGFAPAVDTKLAMALEDAEAGYHIARSSKDMTSSGKVGELGTRAFGGAMGSLLKTPFIMLGQSLMGKPGAVAANVLAAQMAKRGMAANTGLSLLKNADKVAPTAGMLGGTVSKAMRPGTPEEEEELR